jgi:ERF superfamily protein
VAEEYTLPVDPRSTSLAAALWLYQQDPPVLIKDKAGQAGNQPTRYADLAQANDKILTRLNALGVTYSCRPTLVDLADGAQRFVMHYTLRHVPSGETEEGNYPVALNDNPQRMGSALSYARRYVLVNLVNAATEDEDDDGQGAAGRTARRASTGSRTRPRSQKVADDQNPPEPGAEGAPEGSAPDQGMPTPKMQQKLAIQFAELGYPNTVEGKTNRLARMSKYFRREITSIKDLTFQEGKDLIDFLEKTIEERRVQQATGAAGEPDPTAHEHPEEAPAG